MLPKANSRRSRKATSTARLARPRIKTADDSGPDPRTTAGWLRIVLNPVDDISTSILPRPSPPVIPGPSQTRRPVKRRLQSPSETDDKTPIIFAYDFDKPIEADDPENVQAELDWDDDNCVHCQYTDDGSKIASCIRHRFIWGQDGKTPIRRINGIPPVLSAAYSGPRRWEHNSQESIEETFIVS